ncbi:MAG: hypothetical protein LUM44_09745 [Pyrinomonadaceae bacterium]|nr:hypothetical protein [Pyrinomonadaceae bacterium]
MDKLYKVENGRVQIEIDTKNKRAVSVKKKQHVSASGIITPRRENEYLPRRLQKSGIQFYDLGQILVGEVWQDLDFRIVPPVVISSDVFSNFEIDLGEVFFQLREKLFEVPISEWKTKYRKLDYESAERYGLDVIFDEDNSVIYPIARTGTRKQMIDGETDITETKWTPKGLEITTAPVNFGVWSAQAFWSFRHFNTKVTTTLNPLAPTVSFTTSKNCNIFMVPRLCFEIGLGGDTSTIGFSFLNGHIAPVSRELFLNNPVLAANHPYSVLCEFVNESVASPDIAALKANLLEFLSDRAGARHFRGTVGFDSPSSFPTEDIFKIQFSASVIGSGGANSDIVKLSENALVAVIEQNGSFYYVWINSDVPSPRAGISFNFDEES